MADWVTELEQLSKTLDKDLKEAALSAIKDQIDFEVNEFIEFLQKNTPRDSGQLIESITKTKIDTEDRYGWKIEFAGNYPDGTPFEKVANILNFGTATMPGKYFRTRAIRRLKGMDGRIGIRYEIEIGKIKGA